MFVYKTREEGGKFRKTALFLSLFFGISSYRVDNQHYYSGLNSGKEAEISSLWGIFINFVKK